MDWLGGEAAQHARPVADGLILGRVPGGGLMTYQGDSHLATIAPTGTGKTSGPVITNAMNHPGQLIVLDVKGEVHRHTAARRRAMGQEVYVLDLRDDGDPEGCLNPIHLGMACGSEAIVVGRALASQIVERTGQERDPFWNDWAETLIAATIAHQIEDLPACRSTMGEVFDTFLNDDPCYNLAVKLDNSIKYEPARRAFASVLNTAELTRSGILSTTAQNLRIFDSQLVRRRTDRTNFSVPDLIAGKALSLYIIIPPERIKPLRAVLRLWLTGLMMVLTTRRQTPEHRTLMLVDECAQLGAVDSFLTAATLMRSWGVTLWTIWQSVAQLDLYGSQARTLIDNAGVIQLMGPRNYRMANDFAQLIGGITPQEIMAMRPDEQLVMVDGGLPQFIQQARWYQDEAFAGLRP